MSSIKHVMLKDHEKLKELLEKAVDGFGMAHKEQKDLFDFFMNQMEHHMVSEEQAIFSFSHLGDTETQKIIRDLLAEHGEIRRYLNKIQDDFKTQNELDISAFSALLREHQNTENDVLYPKLDKELNESEKEFIVNKIDLLK